jgi:ketosteroid isomerase-like protein
MGATENDALIQTFYAAFGEGDGDGAAACYAPGVRFSDPVFPDLHGEQAGAMWRMLAARSGDLQLDLIEHDAIDDRGSARWLARYTFSQTGRHVENDVRASFRFADGLIVEHTDSFDFYRWTRQALGPPGLLLGWTPIIRSAVRRRAADSLAQFAAASG